MGSDVLRLSGCTVHLRTGLVEREGAPAVRLTDRERRLLCWLAEHPGQDVPRDQLLTELWGYSDQVVSRAIDATMRRLREKVEIDPSQPQHLLTAWGTGYRFEPGQPAPIDEPPPPAAPRRGRSILLGQRRIDLDSGAVIGPSGELPGLTAGERSILAALVRAEGAVVEYQALARLLWGRATGAERAIQSVVYRIRRKVEPDPDMPRFLLTIRGIGYRLVTGGGTSSTVATVVVVRPAADPERWAEDPDGTAAQIASLATMLDQTSVEAGGVPTGDGWCHLFADPDAAAAWAAALREGPWGPSVAIAIHRGPVAWWTNPTGRASCVGPAVLRCTDLAARGAPGTITSEDAGEVPFIGRQAELLRVGELLRSGRIALLAGAGGIGKSRLAREIVAGWPGPVAWCDLGGTTTAAELVRTVGHALELQVRSGRDEAAIGRALAGRGDLLVVLDGIDALDQAAAAEIRRWAAAAPNVRFLGTSRRPTGVEDEVVALGALPQEESRALLDSRARQRGASPSSVVLPGVPLALELAAGRQDADLVRRLASASGDEERVERALEWSWDGLDQDEQSLLSQLAVFEGSFPGAAVEGVCALGTSRARISQVLSRLLERALVVPQGSRLALFDPVRDYVRARLDPETWAALQVRHGAWYGRLARRLAARHRRAVNELLPEYDNLAAAHRAAMARGDLPIAVGTAIGLHEVLRLRGPYDLAVELLTPLVDLASGEDRRAMVCRLSGALAAVGRQEEARALAEQWIPIARQQGDLRALVELLGNLGTIQGIQGEIPAAEANLLEAIALARAHHPRALSVLLTRYANMRCNVGDAEGGERLFREVVDLDPDSPVALWNLAAALLDLGRLDEAEDIALLALECAQQYGDLRIEAFIRTGLGFARDLRGDYEEALALILQGRELHRRVGNRAAVAMSYDTAGQALTSLGRYEEAILALQQACTELRELGMPVEEGRARLALGVALSDAGRIDEALASFRQAAELSRRAGDVAGESVALANQAIAAPSAPQAAALAQRALDLALTLGVRPSALGAAWWAMARTATDPAQAIVHIDQALALEGSSPERVGQVWCLRGEWALALGRRDEALEALARARQGPQVPPLVASIERLQRLLGDAESSEDRNG